MWKNKAINRGVIPLFAEPNVKEWACCVHQRVEMWMKWVMDCATKWDYSNGWLEVKMDKDRKREMERSFDFWQSRKC